MTIQRCVVDMKKITLFLGVFFLMGFVVADNLTLNKIINSSEEAWVNTTESINKFNENSSFFLENLTEINGTVEQIDLLNKVDFALLDIEEVGTFVENVTFLRVVDFFLSSFVEGGEYSLELFEFLLDANFGVGSEYYANLTWDEQSTPNSAAEGSEYSSSVGSYGLLSASPGVPIIYCGDGICNGDETCLSCSADCGMCSADVVSSGGSGGCSFGYVEVDGKCVIIESGADNVSLIEVLENRSKDVESQVPEIVPEVESWSGLKERVIGIIGEIMSGEFARYSILAVGAMMILFIILLIRYLKVKKVKRVVRKKDYIYKKQFGKISKIKSPRIKYRKSKFETLNKIRKLVK